MTLRNFRHPLTIFMHIMMVADICLASNRLGICDILNFG